MKTLKIVLLIFLAFLFGAVFGHRSAVSASKFFRQFGHTVILNVETMTGFIYRNKNPVSMFIEEYPSLGIVYRVDMRGEYQLYRPNPDQMTREKTCGTYRAPSPDRETYEDSLVAAILPIKR